MDKLVYLQQLDLSQNALSVLPHAFIAVASHLKQCNLSATFTRQSTPLVPVRQSLYQPIRLLHASIRALQLSHMTVDYGQYEQGIVPRYLWLQLAQHRRCCECRSTVTPDAWSSWSPLRAVAGRSVAFPLAADESVPVTVYRCVACLPEEQPQEDVPMDMT